MPPSRREILRTAGSALPVGLSGCVANESPPDPADEPTTEPTSPLETESPIAPPDPDNIEAFATVSAQPSADGPARIELSLKNTAEEAFTIQNGAGWPLAYLPTMEAMTGQAGPVDLHPEGSRGVSVTGADLPTEPVNGCWRFPDGAQRGVIEAVKSYFMQPGSVWTIVHAAYFDGPDESCFPPGQYQTETWVEQRRSGATGPRIQLNYQLSISSSGGFEIDVEQSVSA